MSWLTRLKSPWINFKSTHLFLLRSIPFDKSNNKIKLHELKIFEKSAFEILILVTSAQFLFYPHLNLINQSNESGFCINRFESPEGQLWSISLRSSRKYACWHMGSWLWQEESMRKGGVSEKIFVKGYKGVLLANFFDLLNSLYKWAVYSEWGSK